VSLHAQALEPLPDLTSQIAHARPRLEQLVQACRKHGLLRASPRLVLSVPQQFGVHLSRPGTHRATGCCGRGARRPKRPRRSEQPKPITVDASGHEKQVTLVSESTTKSAIDIQTRHVFAIEQFLLSYHILCSQPRPPESSMTEGTSTSRF